jgi:guanine deaminase
VTADLLRAPLFHTPRNPFYEMGALVCHEDGGLLIRDGRIAACGDYSTLSAENPQAVSNDLRGGFLLPGLVDAHIHFPQVRVLGTLGRSLLDWLEHCALPEEAKMSDSVYATAIAREFVHALASHGTTTAMVFGAHFSGATEALFEAAEVSGLRIVSGLVLSDRQLRHDLLISAAAAYQQSSELIRNFHKRGRLLYAVTPRFALSASEAILEVCKTLRAEHADLRFQTHLNENRAEIAEVRRMSPWAQDYFEIYERFGLCGRGAVMAHNVHPLERELDRLSATSTAIAHCPASNAALGSGIFPMHRHVRARVPFALGSDVGGGTGFGILKEGLQAYLMQRVAAEPVTLDGAKLLYLATKAGASALALDHETGDFEVGKSADFVYVRPRPHTPLAAVVDQATSPERILAALFTLAGPETIRQVRVAGSIVYANDD